MAVYRVDRGIGTEMANRKILTSVIIAAMLYWTPLFAADLRVVQLPAPQKEGGKPLMQALNERKTTRTFTGEKLNAQTLSNLLWAAIGVSRPDGRRTAPSAKNWQEIDIYVASDDGLYLYDAGRNDLIQILDSDIRAKTGTQPYVGGASINLIYVANFSKVDEGGFDKNMLVGADTGFIAQNVYLFCSSEGLATVVRAAIDTESLAKEMKLKPAQKIVLAQSVGPTKK